MKSNDYICVMPSGRNTSYLLSLLPACFAIAGNLLGGWYAGLNLGFSFGFLGLLEYFTGLNTQKEHSHPKDAFPAFILLAHITTHTVVFLSLFYGIYAGILSGGFVVLAAISSGAEAGSGSIIIAHELIHKANSLKRFAGKYLLASSGNIYFYIHHLQVHHRYVATSNDEATARKGESVYSFIGRTVPGQIRQAWACEKLRLSKFGKSEWSFKNQILQNAFLQVCIVIFIVFVLPLTAVLAWFFYCTIANLLLEYVNYIEHYGLRRNNNERVNEMHSWNCDRWVSRFFLIDLSRHSDHHFHASKPYHTLDTFPQSPALPGGYASLILPALIPLWWFRLVHPRLDRLKNS